MNIDSIVIDGREKERIKPAKEFFKNAEIYNLDSGDYAFIKENKRVLFEYKTVFDFISSIIDGRVFRQCYQMNKNSFKSYLIIHGDFSNIESLIYTFRKKSKVNFTYNQFIGALARLYCEYNVIQTTGNFESVLYLMSKISEKCFDDKVMRLNTGVKKTDNPALNYLTNIQGVGFKTAELIVKEFNIKSLIELIDVVNNVDLTSIKGVGDVTAKNIKKNIIGENYE